MSPRVKPRAREMPTKKTRDYAAEYARRKARGLAKGLSLAQSRGHPKAAETTASSRRPSKPIDDARWKLALRTLRQEKSLAAAARAAGISPERLRREAAARGALERQGRRWAVKHDLPRQVLIYSRARERIIIVGDFGAASLVGRYMSAIGRFLATNDPAPLAPFAGLSVMDIKGGAHILETRPNTLYRLSFAGGETFEQIYKIIV